MPNASQVFCIEIQIWFDQFGVEELKQSTEDPELNIFGVNWKANCKLSLHAYKASSIKSLTSLVWNSSSLHRTLT